MNSFLIAKFNECYKKHWLDYEETNMKYRYLVKEISTEYTSDLLQEMFDDLSVCDWKLERIETLNDYDTLNTRLLCIFFKTEEDD